MIGHRTLIVLAVFGLVLPLLVLGLREADSLLGHAVQDCGHLTQHLEALDNIAQLPPSPILIIGDKTARHWPQPIDQLDDRPVLVRGIRNLTALSTARCYDRLIAYYRPHAAVVLLGRADVDRLETELAEVIDQMGSAASRLNPGMTLWIAGFLQTPARDNERIERLNRAIASATDTHESLQFVNPNPALQQSEGVPNPEWFWPDGDTLASGGYNSLAVHLSSHLAGPIGRRDRL